MVSYKFPSLFFPFFLLFFGYNITIFLLGKIKVLLIGNTIRN